MSFLKILEMDTINYAMYQKMNEFEKKDFEEKYKKTFRFQFYQLNYYMRKHLQKMEE